MCPARLAYQVCECRMSTPLVASTISRSMPQRLEGGVGAEQRGRDGVGDRIAAGLPPAVHVDVDLAAQLRDEVLDVDARPAVDVRGPLSGQHSYAHEPSLEVLPSSARGDRPRGARVRAVSSDPHVLAIVLAGGEGKRLMPLTADRAKPAVPFGGSYRLDRLRAVEPGQRRPAGASAC